MKREKSVSKKKPKELRVNWVVSGVNQHLAMPFKSPPLSPRSLPLAEPPPRPVSGN